MLAETVEFVIYFVEMAVFVVDEVNVVSVVGMKVGEAGETEAKMWVMQIAQTRMIVDALSVYCTRDNERLLMVKSHHKIDNSLYTCLKLYNVCLF